MATPAPKAPTGPPPASHVQLVRHPDGRHAVLDATGNVLGLHNSLASAQRHMADYYEPKGAVGIPENSFTPQAPQEPGNAPAPNIAAVLQERMLKEHAMAKRQAQQQAMAR